MNKQRVSPFLHDWQRQTEHELTRRLRAQSLLKCDVSCALCLSWLSRRHWCRTFYRSVSPRIHNSTFSSWCCSPIVSCHRQLNLYPKLLHNFTSPTRVFWSVVFTEGRYEHNALNADACQRPRPEKNKENKGQQCEDEQEKKETMSGNVRRRGWRREKDEEEQQRGGEEAANNLTKKRRVGSFHYSSRSGNFLQWREVGGARANLTFSHDDDELSALIAAAYQVTVPTLSMCSTKCGTKHSQSVGRSKYATQIRQLRTTSRCASGFLRTSVHNEEDRQPQQEQRGSNSQYSSQSDSFLQWLQAEVGGARAKKLTRNSQCEHSFHEGRYWEWCCASGENWCGLLFLQPASHHQIMSCRLPQLFAQKTRRFTPSQSPSWSTWLTLSNVQFTFQKNWRSHHETNVRQIWESDIRISRRDLWSENS